MKINQSTPLFSIITVCRNSEKTIERTIKSVLGQTFKNLEYIIIDGASDDNTLNIVNKYRDQIDVVISEADSGIYDAMNKGIALSKGEVIGIINSDDWYEPSTLGLAANAIKNLNSPAVIHGLCKYYEGGKEGKILGYNHDVLKTHNIAHPTCFVPSVFYKKYGSFRTEFFISADYELLLRLYLNDVPFFRIERVLANFSSGGITSKFRLNDDKTEIHLLHNLISKKRYRIRKTRKKFKRIKNKLIEAIYKLLK